MKGAAGYKRRVSALLLHLLVVGLEEWWRQKLNPEPYGGAQGRQMQVRLVAQLFCLGGGC